MYVDFRKLILTTFLPLCSLYVVGQNSNVDFKPDDLPKAPKAEKKVSFVPEPGQTKRVYRPGTKTGIDVSHYQGNINWEKAAKDKAVGFVYLKATESATLVDNTYRRNLQGAHKAGILVGAYHFFSPTSSVKDQLNNFLSTVDPQTQDLIPIVDVEKRGKESLSVFVSRLHQFCDGVEKEFGVKPIVYCSPNFYNKYLAKSFLAYPIMLARYGDEVPSVVDDINFILWQYTSMGHISGISANVDISRFMEGHSIQDIIYRKGR